MTSAHIVVDLGFGDSGKGVTVDRLAERAPETSLVIRFSGGHQVGHTVVRNGRRHTFSSFGAATLLGVPTYYLPDTTLFPPAAMVERELLRPIKPQVLAHPLAMITTPYDVAYNRATERVNQHGSCGVGFGATVERHQFGVTLQAKDLTNRWVAGHKLVAANGYYRAKLAGTAFASAYADEIEQLDDQVFLDACAEFMDDVIIATVDQLPPERHNLVFEGSQGIMLDKIHGIFPHVTRSDTTSKGALDMLRSTGSLGSVEDPVNVHYVTRCYQTRHGNGPMSSTVPVALVNNGHEANVDNDYQGSFRTAELDADLLNYALATDAAHHGGFTIAKHLVVTCLDQRPDFDVDRLLSNLDTTFDTVAGGYGQAATDVRVLRPLPTVRSTDHVRCGQRDRDTSPVATLALR